MKNIACLATSAFFLETKLLVYNDISILVVSLIVRVENNKGGQNVGGQQREENQGSALDQLRNTFVSVE